MDSSICQSSHAHLFIILTTTVLLLFIIPLATPTQLLQYSSWQTVPSFSSKARPTRQPMHFTVDTGQYFTAATQVGGLPQRQQNLQLEKFRALLGLKSLHKNTLPPSTFSYLASPSPAPTPTTLTELGQQPPSPAPSRILTEPPSPAPSRMQPIPLHPPHHHPHHRLPHSSFILPHHNNFDDHIHQKKRTEKILLAVLVSVAASLAILTLVFITICMGRRLYWQRKRSNKSISIRSTEAGSTGGGRGKIHTSSNLGAKVRYDGSAIDLFYLNTITTVLEPQAPPVKSNHPLTTQSSTTIMIHDNERPPKHEEGATNSTILAEEIISVHDHECEESIKYESDARNSSPGDKNYSKTRPVRDSSDDDDDDEDDHDHDDESFHSPCDSLSSNNPRPSNVSESSSSILHKAVRSSPKQSPSSHFDSALPPISPPTSPWHPYTKRRSTQGTLNYYPGNQEGLNYCPTLPTPPLPPPPPPPSFNTRHSSLVLAQKRSTTPPSIIQSNTKLGSSTIISNPVQENNLPLSPKTLDLTTKPPSNIVPPPLSLPPCTNGSSSSSKGPPPPPAPPPQIAPLGKDGAPLPKLKPLHWDKVKATPDRSMVWDRLRSSSFELDEEMIETLFGYNLKNALQNEEGRSKTPSPGKHVLEPKRLQNMTILSKALNVTAQQVCEAIVQGDGLSLQQLEALAKMSPTKEEEAKLSNYKGNIDELGYAEKLVKSMLKVPFAFQRIEAMLYRATFEDEVVHLKNSFAILEEACEELRSSRLFLKLLEAVLKTGNRMNMGTIRGGAKAFKLDALLKLADVKGTDGKTTLLHFVVQEIMRSEGMRMSNSIIGKINQSKNNNNNNNNKSRTIEDKEEDYRRMGLDLVSGLSTELYNVKKTASIDLDVLGTSVSNLSSGMSKLQKLVLRQMDKDQTSIGFVRGMKSFMNNGEENIKELKEHENKVLCSVKEITEYFHGDVGKEEANLLRIFVIVRDFLGMLDQVCRELKSLKTPRSPNPLAPFR